MDLSSRIFCRKAYPVMDSLIPEIPASPVNKDSSFSSEEEHIPCGQRTPTKRNDNRIKLQEDTYKKVKSNADMLKELQSRLITLTKEISRIDGDKNTTYHQLKVQRNPPKLRAQLNHSEEFTDSWNQVLQRAGRNLRRVWNDELSCQAKRQRDRFLEKRSRAETDLESTLEAPEGGTQAFEDHPPEVSEKGGIQSIVPTKGKSQKATLQKFQDGQFNLASPAVVGKKHEFQPAMLASAHS
ncbi:hypothetical protein BSL78_10142 [Apostichopus japonicus]|uniref:Uncharacterized protein n=1 Tax=Stichopus japonicus TaxID=307972 RepID=A0A2G8KYB5_STIJA|nr:hypothetical protein BSL78_10142 [Apostichopus japonicus]